MSPNQRLNYMPSIAGVARQQEHDRSDDALRQAMQRADRVIARQSQEARAGRTYHSQLPHIGPLNPRAARSSEELPFVFEQHTASPDVSPKTQPDQPARTSSMQTRWTKPGKDKNVAQKYVPAAPQDPSHFRLEPIRETPISSPLQPHLYDLRVHVEQDHQQRYQTFEFDMRFKLRLAPGLPASNIHQK